MRHQEHGEEVSTLKWQYAVEEVYNINVFERMKKNGAYLEMAWFVWTPYDDISVRERGDISQAIRDYIEEYS